MTTRCDHCGFQWDDDKAFIRYRPAFHIRPIPICRACWSRRSETGQGKRFVYLILYSLLGGAFVWSQPEQPMGWLLLNLVLFDLCGFISALIHELGHAFAAKFVGMRVFLVQVGSGCQLFGKEMFGFRLQFHRYPLLGGVTYAGHMERQRLLRRQAIYVSAGPLSNLALCGLLLLAIDNPHWKGIVNSVFSGIAITQILFLNSIVMFAVNMIPRNVRGSLGVFPSDGKQLLQLLRAGGEYIEKALEGAFVAEACYWHSVNDDIRAEQICRDGLSRYPNSKMLGNSLCVALLNTCRYHEGREQLIRLLAVTGTDEYGGLTRALLLNNIAWANLMIGDKGLLPEADEYSQQAYGAFNDIASFQNTRGATLIELGKVDEGIGLIIRARQRIDKRDNIAINAAYLALGEWARGNKEKALAHLEDVKRFDEDCPLLPRVLETVGGENRLSASA